MRWAVWRIIQRREIWKSVFAIFAKVLQKELGKKCTFYIISVPDSKIQEATFLYQHVEVQFSLVGCAQHSMCCTDVSCWEMQPQRRFVNSISSKQSSEGWTDCHSQNPKLKQPEDKYFFYQCWEGIKDLPAPFVSEWFSSLTPCFILQVGRRGGGGLEKPFHLEPQYLHPKSHFHPL